MSRLKTFDATAAGNGVKPAVQAIAQSQGPKVVGRASTDLARMNSAEPALRRKYEKFLEVANQGKDALEVLFQNYGGWLPERLQGGSSWSVRLNQGYRVEFTVGDDGSVKEILCVAIDCYKH
jgi:hypothetical protein